MSFYDSDYDCDSEYSNGEPYLPMMEEVRRGELSAIQEALVQRRLNPNARDDDYSLLHWAAGHTDTDNLEWYRLDSDNIAARTDIVRELLNYGANVNTVWVREEIGGQEILTPMNMTDDAGVVRMLREASVQQALTTQQTSTEYEKKMHLAIGLLSAAALGRTEECSSFCRQGADVNENFYDETALGEAAKGGHLSTIQTLVEEFGANVNTQTDINRQTTPLYFAVVHGHEEVVEYLLEQGANPLQERPYSGGMSKYACTEGGTMGLEDVVLPVRSRIIERILSASVDKVKSEVAIKEDYDANHWRHTAQWRDYSWTLMECVRHGYIDGIEQLVANPKFKLPPTCLQLAVAVGERATLVYLLKCGALTTYNAKGEEQRWYGYHQFKPSEEAVQSCKETLSAAEANGKNQEE